MKWSRWLTWLGVALAAAGIVIGVWLQVSAANFPLETEERLTFALEALGMIGAGALLAVAAQIMGMMQAAAQRQSSN